MYCLLVPTACCRATNTPGAFKEAADAAQNALCASIMRRRQQQQQQPYQTLIIDSEQVAFEKCKSTLRNGCARRPAAAG